jgi:hypothetical protein
MHNSKRKYRIFAFRAVDEPGLCMEYIDGHIKILTDFGVANITSNNNTWINNPNIYCIGLMDDNTNELLGGIRIQLADGINPLPIEGAIGYMDSKIYDLVEHYAQNGGIGELSGLWVDNKLRGLGMGPYLVRASITSSNQLNFKTLTGICAKYSFQMFNNVGFVIDKSFGLNGGFPYPNEEYITHVVGILNAITLKDARKYDKDIMFSLRENNVQKRIESDKGIEVNIAYSLTYPKVVEVKYMKKASQKRLNVNPHII